MYYVEQYQRYRQGSLKYEQNLRKSTSQNWSLCSHEYEAKCPPLNSSSSSDVVLDHQQHTVLFLTQLASIDKVSERHTFYNHPTKNEIVRCCRTKTSLCLQITMRTRQSRRKKTSNKCADEFHFSSHQNLDNIIYLEIDG